MIRLIRAHYVLIEQLHVKAKHVGKSTGSVWAGVVTTGLVTAFPRPSHMWSSHRVQLPGPDTPCCRPGVLTHNTWQYQRDSVRTISMQRLQMIGDLFTLTTYGNSWTLNN